MYNTNIENHKIKKEINDYLIQNYLSNYVSSKAIIMPSTTWQVEEMHAKAGIFNPKTKFFIIEKGIVGYEINNFRNLVEEQSIKIFGRNFNYYDEYEKWNLGIKYGKSLHQIYQDMNFERPEKTKFDFANFDTCSTVLHLNEWIIHFIKIIRDSSPILFTFDLDGTNRQKGKDFSFLDKNDLSVFDCEFKSFGNIRNKKELSDKILRIKSYLDSIGIQIKFVGAYKEINSTYTMGVFYGIKNNLHFQK